MEANKILAAAENIAIGYGLDLNFNLMIDANQKSDGFSQRMILVGIVKPAVESNSAEEAKSKIEGHPLTNLFETLRSISADKVVVKVSADRHHQYLLELFNIRCAEYAKAEVKEMAVYQS